MLTQTQVPCKGGNCCQGIQLWYRQVIQPFWKLKVTQVFCVIYVLVLTFSTPQFPAARYRLRRVRANRPTTASTQDPIMNKIVDPTSIKSTNNRLVCVKDICRLV